MKARDAYGIENDDAVIFNVDVTRSDGGFFRKGETGDWKVSLTPELEAKVDTWIAKNVNDVDISFKYSI